MKLLRDIGTDYDGQTYDTGRVVCVALVLSMIAFESVSIWRGHPFDPQGFGIGMASILGALGAAIAGDNHRRP